MDWEDRLDDWELELELGAQLDGSDWVTLEKAAAETGVSRAALRTWYRTGQIPSRLVDGPHGPQRLVPLALVAERAEASPRVRKTAERRLADEAQLELLRHRVDQLELRLAELSAAWPAARRRERRDCSRRQLCSWLAASFEARCHVRCRGGARLVGSRSRRRGGRPRRRGRARCSPSRSAARRPRR